MSPNVLTDIANEQTELTARELLKAIMEEIFSQSEPSLVAFTQKVKDTSSGNFYEIDFVVGITDYRQIGNPASKLN